MVKISGLVLALIPALAFAGSSSLQFVPAPHSAAQGVVPMRNGSVAVFGSIDNNSCTANPPGSCDQTLFPLLSILDASGNQTAALASSGLGSGNSSIAGAAVDANGNLWITGETDSDDFPLVHPIYAQKAAYMKAGFAAKLDPSLNILFSTFLGGQPALGQSNPVAIALDNSGNAFVVGSTNDPSFPTTGAVFGSGSPSSNPLSPATYTFVVKIASNGSSQLFSRLLGTNRTGCIPTNVCYVQVPETLPRAAAVDSNGNLTVVGSTDVVGFPVTANVYSGGIDGFVTRISADGSQLIWSTAFGNRIPAAGAISSANSIALDPDNNVYITGFTYQPITATPGALQALPTSGHYGNSFAVKLSSDATQLLYAANFTATLSGVTLDSARNAWITGTTIYGTFGGAVNATNFPGLSNVPYTGLDFALELNADGSAEQQIFSFLPPTVTQPPAFDSSGNLLLLATAGNLLRLNPLNALTAPAVFAITNSAVPQAAAGVASGELMTIYGVGLGPAVGIPGEPDQNGLYPAQLGGVSVKVGGVAAALLYVGANQINLQAPFFGPEGPTVFSLGTPASIVVTTPTGPLPTLQPQVAGSLGIFGVVNEDGTINSPSSPAAEGSIVMVYLTGLGGTVSGQLEQAGAISLVANSAFLTQIQATYLNLNFGVLYAGTAPDVINGLDQVNLQLPFGIPNPQLAVQTLPVVTSVSTSSGIVTPVGSAVVSNVITVYTH